MFSRLILFATLLGAAAAEVIVLTDKTFETSTQASTGATTGDWFVKFYAPWCGHCQALKGPWEELATEAEGSEDRFNVAEVNVSGQNQRLMKRFGIESLPTIRFFSKGKMYDYPGARDAKSMYAFVRPTEPDVPRSYLEAEGEDVPPHISALEWNIELAKAHVAAAVNEARHLAETKQEVAAVLAFFGLGVGLVASCALCGSCSGFYAFLVVFVVTGAVAAGAVYTSPAHPHVVTALEEISRIVDFKKNAAAVLFIAGIVSGVFVNLVFDFCGCGCGSAAPKSKSKKSKMA